MKVVILAGGLGTRLAEQTQVRPKPMVEIGGRPILWHIMKIYRHYGFRRFVLCAGYKAHVIKQFFREFGVPADEEGSLSDRDEFQVYNGSIVPGEHTLTVNLEYRGHGYGIFSYLKGYRFKVRSNYSFTAPEGRAVTVRVVGYEKGGPTAPLEERPAIRYQEEVSERRRRRASSDEEDQE